MKKALIALACLVVGCWIGFSIISFFTASPEDKKKQPAKQITKTNVVPKPQKTSTPPKKAAPVKQPVKKEVVVPKDEVKARVCLVLDDWGYNLNSFKLMKSIKEPLVLAVLPHMPYTEKIAREGYANGHEIILHLPMESQVDLPIEDGALLTKMNVPAIMNETKRAIDSVPYLRGVSNHMGSKFTSNKAGMRATMEIIQSEGLFFLDSFVVNTSVAREVAQEFSLPYLRRDVFLDNERNKEYIRGQLSQLKKKALRNGVAIGIGHDEAVTLEVIQEIIPSWKKEGIEFVTLTTLLKNDSFRN